MRDKVFIDTNIWVYLYSKADNKKYEDSNHNRY